MGVSKLLKKKTQPGAEQEGKREKSRLKEARKKRLMTQGRKSTNKLQVAILTSRLENPAGDKGEVGQKRRKGKES